ncbi:MAG: hypothetical protein EP298_01720 [Gammaproteobacteria bacterium]|nr:MAG: hypothetical protein EP298_01720 [Gammaproteobacteria bacterium]UTW43923.1 hypothetical protein KFE69_07490 [bacterium SCSIO 12844]
MKLIDMIKLLIRKEVSNKERKGAKEVFKDDSNLLIGYRYPKFDLILTNPELTNGVNSQLFISAHGAAKSNEIDIANKKIVIYSPHKTTLGGIEIANYMDKEKVQPYATVYQGKLTPNTESAIQYEGSIKNEIKKITGTNSLSRFRDHSLSQFDIDRDHVGAIEMALMYGIGKNSKDFPPNAFLSITSPTSLLEVLTVLDENGFEFDSLHLSFCRVTLQQMMREKFTSYNIPSRSPEANVGDSVKFGLHGDVANEDLLSIVDSETQQKLQHGEDHLFRHRQLHAKKTITDEIIFEIERHQSRYLERLSSEQSPVTIKQTKTRLGFNFTAEEKFRALEHAKQYLKMDPETRANNALRIDDIKILSNGRLGQDLNILVKKYDFESIENMLATSPKCQEQLNISEHDYFDINEEEVFAQVLPKSEPPSYFIDPMDEQKFYEAVEKGGQPHI